MNLRRHLAKFKFSYYGDGDETSSGPVFSELLHRMSPSKTYKQLYTRFFWQFALFLLTLNVTASIYQSIEGQVRSSNVADISTARGKILRDFSAAHNVSRATVARLFSDVSDAGTAGNRRNLYYTEAFMLALSTFFTIGWGDVTPQTSGGKAFTVLSSCIGIPLTIVVITTAAKLLIRHLQDGIRATQTNYNNTGNKYGDTKITSKTRVLLLPTLLIIFITYWFLMSLAIIEVEKFSYVDAMYYSFVSFTTIGFGDFVHKSHMEEGAGGRAFGLTLFCFLWTFGGVVLIAANVLTIYLYMKKPMRLRKKRNASRIARYNKMVIDKYKEDKTKVAEGNDDTTRIDQRSGDTLLETEK